MATVGTNRNKLVLKLATVLLPSLFSLPLSTMGVVLTDAILYTSDANGNGATQVWWDTLSTAEESTNPGTTHNVYIARDAASPVFLNTGDSAGTIHPSINLNIGTETLYVFSDQSGQVFAGTYTLNLFFDGDNVNPGISGVVDFGSSSFVGGTGTSARRVDGDPNVTGGGLTYTAPDSTTVTLTGLSMGQSVGDFVQGLNSVPGGQQPDRLTTAQFTIVPEPSTFALFLGLGSAALLRRRRFS